MGIDTDQAAGSDPEYPEIAKGYEHEKLRVMCYFLKPHQFLWDELSCGTLAGYLASPDGRLLSAAPEFFRVGNGGLWQCNLNPLKPDIETLELVARASQDRKIFNGDIPAVDSGYYVSFRTWCIRNADDMKVMLGDRFEREADVWDIAKAFSGWSVCLSEAEVGKDAEDIINLSFSEGGSHPLIDQPSNGQAFLIKCIFEAYPDGKGDASWDVVESRVGSSRRSINRALDAIGKKADWLRTK